MILFLPAIYLMLTLQSLAAAFGDDDWEFPTL